MAKSKLTVIDRFMLFVSPEPMSGCWLWLGHTMPKGYGTFKIGLGQFLAHRVSYELHVGPIPEGLTLDHLCRLRCCVNWQHQEPVTNTVNCRRGQAVRKKKTHCPQGHEFTPENILPQGGGKYWRCRICARAACMKSYFKSRAK